MEDFSYPQRYKCGFGKSEASETKPKFGMYYGVPAHKECDLPVSNLGIIQGGLYSEGVHKSTPRRLKILKVAIIGLLLRPVPGATKPFPMVSQ